MVGLHVDENMYQSIVAYSIAYLKYAEHQRIYTCPVMCAAVIMWKQVNRRLVELGVTSCLMFYSPSSRSIKCLAIFCKIYLLFSASEK